ncbi:MAG: lipoprotein [Tardiphaga sp.]
MTSSTRPASARWALLVLTASALALAGCGRKGGLDLPPQASNTQPLGTATPSADPDANTAANKGNALFSPVNPTDEAQATRGRKKSFLLDPILD